MKIAVHNGVFHADDVFCIALMQLIDEKIEVVRTRDEKVIGGCDLAADVGEGPYDHHQRDKVLREDEIPYSAFGLLWRDYGIKLVSQIAQGELEEELLEEVVKQVAQEFITQIDASDNGIQLNTYESPVMTLSQVISSFVPMQGEEQSMDEAFFEAVHLAKHILRKEVCKCIGAYLNRKQVEKELANQPIDNTHYLILDGGIKWKEALVTLDIEEKVWFVVFEDTTGSWRIQTVPKEMGSFVARVNLPEEWGGKREDELESLLGIGGCIFCHPNLFIAGNQTKEGAIKMAQVAVTESMKK